MNVMANIFSFVCLGTSIYMAVKGVTGWGWFLFVGMIVYEPIKIKINNREQDEET